VAGELKAQVGELPQARRRRYVTALGLSEKDAAILAGDRATGDFFEQILAAGADAKRAGTLMETLREIGNERGEPAVRVGVSPPGWRRSRPSWPPASWPGTRRPPRR
jgi:aspartyl-tRNA(Asn)/glutamyl-tRNA(Gln) amidotransferase subunit B